MSKKDFEPDYILEKWKSEGFPDNKYIDMEIERCKMFIEYRSNLELDSPEMYFISVEQLNNRLKWLKSYKRFSESKIWRDLNEKG